jgi:hypothetical protein
MLPFTAAALKRNSTETVVPTSGKKPMPPRAWRTGNDRRRRGANRGPKCRAAASAAEQDLGIAGHAHRDPFVFLAAMEPELPAARCPQRKLEWQ